MDVVWRSCSDSRHVIKEAIHIVFFLIFAAFDGE